MYEILFHDVKQITSFFPQIKAFKKKTLPDL